MPARKEHLVVSELLHAYKQRRRSCAVLHCSRTFLLIKALSDSSPFPKGKSRNHLPGSQASSLNGTEMPLNGSHDGMSEFASEGKRGARFHLQFTFDGSCEGQSSQLKV